MSGGVGAELFHPRNHAHPSKIKAISIPAGLERNIAIKMPFRVKIARLEEKVKVPVSELISNTAQLPGKFCPPATVTIVDAFVDPPGVVKDSK